MRHATPRSRRPPAHDAVAGCALIRVARMVRVSRRGSHVTPTTMSGIMLGRSSMRPPSTSHWRYPHHDSDLSTKAPRLPNGAGLAQPAATRVDRCVPGGARRRTRTIASDATYAVTGKRIVSRGTARPGASLSHCAPGRGAARCVFPHRRAGSRQPPGSDGHDPGTTARVDVKPRPFGMGRYERGSPRTRFSFDGVSHGS